MVSRRTRANLAGQIGRFVQQYARKALKGWDPNDRTYDRKIEKKMKRLKPEELSDLLSDEDMAVVEPGATRHEPK
jgi:hypothetical protein